MLFLALLVMVALVAAACGSSGGSKGGSSGGGGSSDGGLPTNNPGTPQKGGTITYGLEGKTTAFCLPSAQLAISGIMVVERGLRHADRSRPTTRTCTRRTWRRSVTATPTTRQWTIGLRSGIKFQDGEPLNAAAVKQNIDAWRKGILLAVRVHEHRRRRPRPDDMTVVVTMKTPWVAFPAYLWTSGRAGIAAPAQLNDDATCDTNMIGTGPFKLTNVRPDHR